LKKKEREENCYIGQAAGEPNRGTKNKSICKNEMQLRKMHGDGVHPRVAVYSRTKILEFAGIMYDEAMKQLF
jgi:hypothetical protein